MPSLCGAQALRWLTGQQQAGSEGNWKTANYTSSPPLFLALLLKGFNSFTASLHRLNKSSSCYLGYRSCFSRLWQALLWSACPFQCTNGMCLTTPDWHPEATLCLSDSSSWCPRICPPQSLIYCTSYSSVASATAVHSGTAHPGKFNEFWLLQNPLSAWDKHKYSRW